MTFRKSTVLAMVLAALAGNSGHAADLYVLSSTSFFANAPTSFGKIDTTTKTYTQITSSIDATNSVGNLAWNPAISAFYVSAGPDIANRTLRTLTTSGTLSASLGTLGAQWGMAYRTSDNTLYGVNYLTEAYGTINTSTGAFTQLTANVFGPNDTTSPAYGHMTIHNDTIYGAASISDAGAEADLGKFGSLAYTAASTFQEIVPNNSTYQNIIPVSDGVNLYGLFSDGTDGAQTLYQINPATGGLTNLGTISGTGLGTYFHGAGFVPVPEPSTYVLGALATGVMTLLARRRKANRMA